MSAIGHAAVLFLLGAAACLAIGRLTIPMLLRAQRLAPGRYEDCPPLQAYQQAKQHVPTMGGLFVLAAGLLVAAAGGGLVARDGWIVLGSLLAFGSLGLIDDGLKFQGPNGRGLRAMPKLFIALALGAAVGAASGVTPQGARMLAIPWLQRSVEIGWWWIPCAMVVIAGSAHAVNLTDGMDGLAAGCAAIVFSALGLVALAAEPPPQALVAWCASLAGTCVGFLWFNSFPASVFLGDVGSLALGAALGTISLLMHEPLWLAVIGGVFVIEALSVMLQVASYKWRGQRRIFRVAPLHHHFHVGGMSEPKVIVRFWIVGLMLALLGFTTLALP